MTTVNHKQVEIALVHVSGTDFEKFFHMFYSALTGIQFIPLGGVHDGGADAFLDESIYEGKSPRPGTFYQASIEKEFRSKIRQTVERLREVGRNPRVLNYFSSRTVRYIDKVEEELSSNFNLDIKIRDRNWILGSINNSPQTVAAFHTYLRPHINFLDEIGGNTLIRQSSEKCHSHDVCISWTRN